MLEEIGSHSVTYYFNPPKVLRIYTENEQSLQAPGLAVPSRARGIEAGDAARRAGGGRVQTDALEPIPMGAQAPVKASRSGLLRAAGERPLYLLQQRFNRLRSIGFASPAAELCREGRGDLNKCLCLS